jgi:HAD superfamily hydrolase (TIGR01509 family)
VIDCVIFDLDGVLVDSEDLWDRSRRELAEQAGRPWPAGATEAMQGMSSTEWSAYLHDEVGVPLEPGVINERVVARLLGHYRDQLPAVPGATDAVRRLASRWPLGLASSSNRPVIESVLDLLGVGDLFRVTVSSEEVARGKPAPDVYLEAARRLDARPGACAVIEDSANGIRAGLAAGMRVVAIPNPQFPPAEACWRAPPGSSPGSPSSLPRRSSGPIRTVPADRRRPRGKWPTIMRTRQGQGS